MEELGSTLYDVLKDKRFGVLELKSIAMLGIELVSSLTLNSIQVERIKNLHEIGIIHGDLKPQNIMLSRDLNSDTQVYLIDFGVSHPYLDQNQNHLMSNNTFGYRGTVAFSSPKDDIMASISRRDDLFNLFYLLIFLAKGHLPWFYFMKENEHCESKFQYLSQINQMKRKCAT